MEASDCLKLLWPRATVVRVKEKVFLEIRESWYSWDQFGRETACCPNGDRHVGGMNLAWASE
jgi:hypothetical protein